MLTGTIRNQVDSIWNAFWSGGISNPLEVIEQITYLLLKRVDELETAAELAIRRDEKATPKQLLPRWQGQQDFDGAGLCSADRKYKALSLRQAGCELPGAGAAGEVQWKPQALRSHHETRKFHAAFSSGGGRAGNGP